MAIIRDTTLQNALAKEGISERSRSLPEGHPNQRHRHQRHHVGWNVVYDYGTIKDRNDIESAIDGVMAENGADSTPWLVQDGAGELVMDLFDIICHHWVVRGKPSFVVITDEMLWHYRSRSKRTVANLQKQQAAMREILRIQFKHSENPNRLRPLLTWRSVPTGKPTANTDQLNYLIEIGDLLRGEDLRGPAYTPQIGAFYESRLWAFHPIQDQLMRQLMRYLRLEWRDHPEDYVSGGETSFRSWEYHLTGCGLDLNVLSRRPSEFYQRLHTGVPQRSQGATKGQTDSTKSALGKLIKSDMLEVRGLPGYEPGDVWHHYLYEPGAKPEHCVARNGFDNFLQLKVRLLPPPLVAEALRKQVVGRRRGRVNQQANDNQKSDRHKSRRHKGRRHKSKDQR